MQVKNIECQIAQAQMRRYLTGEEMPQALVSDLEAHLKNCPECMAQAQSQRESLSGILAAKIMGNSSAPAKSEAKGSAIPNRYVKRPAPERSAVLTAPTKAAVQTPLDIIDTPDELYAAKKKVKKKANYKTVAYSIGLAALLVLMSTVFKDPTALFGAKASELKKDTPPQESSAADTGKTQENSKTVATPPPVTEDSTDQNTEDSSVTDQDPVDTGKDVALTAPAADKSSTTSGADQDSTGRKVVPVGKDDIIVADSADGTTVEGPAPKKAPGNSTLKVYPPAKR